MAEVYVVKQCIMIFKDIGFDRFGENTLGIFSTKEKAVNACNAFISESVPIVPLTFKDLSNIWYKYRDNRSIHRYISIKTYEFDELVNSGMNIVYFSEDMEFEKIGEDQHIIMKGDILWQKK